MSTELENGKEWAHRTAEETARVYGICGEIDWISKNEGGLALILRTGDCETEVISFNEIQLRRATYDFDIQHNLGMKIRSAVMEIHQQIFA